MSKFVKMSECTFKVRALFQIQLLYVDKYDNLI